VRGYGRIVAFVLFFGARVWNVHAMDVSTDDGLVLCLADRYGDKPQLDVAQLPGRQRSALRIRWKDSNVTEHAYGGIRMTFQAPGCNRLKFDVCAVESEGTRLVVYLRELDGDRWAKTIDLSELERGVWQSFDLGANELKIWGLGDGKRDPDRVCGLNFELSGKGGTATILLSNVTVTALDGERGAFDRAADPLFVIPPTYTPIVPVQRTSRVFVGMSMGYFASQAGQTTIEELNKLISNLGVVAVVDGGWWPHYDSLISKCRKRGIDCRVENGGVRGMQGFIHRNAAWGVNSRGQSWNVTAGIGESRWAVHGVSYCHPATREAIRQIALCCRAHGVESFEQIDYVWPWFGGAWGYHEADFAAYRNALAERDEGLELAYPRGKRIHFWEYAEAYGCPRWVPDDFGLNSWGEFTPDLPSKEKKDDSGRRRRFLFLCLIHYEWLRFAQEIGSALRAHGGRFMASLNPEGVENGTDYIYWLRLASTDTPYLEYFGSPARTEDAFHRIPVLRREANRSGKRLGLILELGVTGHGKPYWDPEVAFVATYDYTAAGFDDLQNEWLDEANWERLNTNPYHRDRLCNFLATAYAFSLAKADGAAPAPRSVLYIGLRPVVHAGGARTRFDLADVLGSAYIPFDAGDISMLSEDWEHYSVIVYSPWESPCKHFDKLARWLDRKPDRILITHGAVPTRVCAGTGYLPTREIGSGCLGEWLGLGIVRKVPTHTAIHITESKLVAKFPPELRFRGGLFGLSGEGRRLVLTDAGPLVSEVHRLNGSRLVYLHYAAGQHETEQLDRTLLTAILSDTVNVQPAAGSAYVHTYRIPHGAVTVLYDKGTCEAFHFVYDRRKQRFPYNAPDVRCSICLSVRAATAYRIYDFLGDRERVTNSGPKGVLTLGLSGVSCALVYHGQDTPEWRETIASLRTFRKKLSREVLSLLRSRNAK